jgi:hypothetical protein
MPLSQEEVSNIVKFLNSENQKGVFVLDEFVVVGSFWEKLKKAIKEENFDLDYESLDLLERVLNVCLNRKGNDVEVLRTVLSLLDKVQTLKDAAKPSEETKIEEVSS